ncbi:Membrane-spanning 4-domains subfamily A member 4D [Lemmus lemmus]
METMQGLERTTIEVAPGDALPSERSVVRSQLWKVNAEKFLKGEPKVLGFILSGSLSIAAGMRTTKVLVTTSLSFNTISSVVAADTSIIGFFSVLMSLRFTTLRIAVGIEALKLILNVLEFCIAVSTSAFGCKATCCNTSEVVVVLPPNPAVSAESSLMVLRPSAPPVYQERNVPENLYKTSAGERVQF